MNEVSKILVAETAQIDIKTKTEIICTTKAHIATTSLNRVTIYCESIDCW